MSVTPETLHRLLESVVRDDDPVRRDLLERFAACLLHGVETHPIGGDRALAVMAAEAFEWIGHREPDETRVRVHNPSDRPGHTVVEVLRDDQPFIVDSLRLELRRRGLQERNVIHPLLPVVRGSGGELEEILDARNGTPLESYVYIELVPALSDSAACDELASCLRDVMQWITEVTADHRRMILSIREAVAKLEFACPAIDEGEERVAKVSRFLDWIADGRFVFVGMRRYSVDEVGGETEVAVVPGTGLGMWREDETSRLFRPRRGKDVPIDVQEEIEDPRIIFISKSYMESRIHRHGRLDRIMVKEHDEAGRVVGMLIVVGLFKGRVLRTPGSQIPLLSERLDQILEVREVRRGSHRYQSYVTAFDSMPVEMLIGSDVEQIGTLLDELRDASGSMSVRVVTRKRPNGRILYAAILIPREHYREDLRAGIRQLLMERTAASYIDDRTIFLDEGTAIVHCFCSAAEGTRLDPDLAALEESIRSVCAPWEDQLLDALRTVGGHDGMPDTAARYETAFPEPFRVATHPMDAVRDVHAIEMLIETGEPQFALWFDQGDEQRETATLRLYMAEPPLLSDVLPATQRFGVQVVDAQLAEVRPLGQAPVAVLSLRILPLGSRQRDLDALQSRLGDALTRTLTGVVSDDALNGLVLGAGLEWRQIDLMRAFLEYFFQIQGTLSRPYLRTALLENPLAVRILVRFFEARFDPSIPDATRQEKETYLRETFETYRDRITALNEDRALQGFMNLFESTLRTNYFTPPSKPHRMVFKLDSTGVRELSGVKPHREIFVHSTELTGIHLRGGAVARGGLRWSDRTDDLRTEILDLMSTQMLKNGLIVPVGAKGGFVLREKGLSATEARANADAQYRLFIASLLDVTDNLAPDGAVLPPDGVRRLDGDDPYLVVAADKGTAHLSDTANAIAIERDFWLGDAFASGGSEGYDHKKYAITARGAWECVKHHFAELGTDPETDPYTAAGIGDMSGDVFGNGLLLARRARLVAAFDHRHVFLDPEPDPETAWIERKRLFELPRSSWSDYAPDLISPGGGVWPRSAKAIPVPETLRERLGIDAAEVTGQEMVRAILSMQVDLLWNGGIGTYVKSSSESHDAAGDRANDAVRVDATELRARIIGEGGNLGLTQRARVEAALRGVRLNTDAIDNSAGVDLSDHEVNYKIALAPLVRAGALGGARRRELLFDDVAEACESVLAHNRSQAICLSLDRLRAERDPDAFLRATDTLCRFAQIDPSHLELPDEGTVMDRGAHGQGFTRPELAVLVGLAKLHAQALLHGSGFLDDPYLAPLYESYFPERLRAELGDGLADHRLRAETTGLRVVNRLVDAGGATLFDALCTELGTTVPVAASAMIQAEDLLRAPAIREQLLAGGAGAREGMYRASIELDHGVRAVARFLVKSGSSDLDGARIVRWRSILDTLVASVETFLSTGEAARFQARRDRLLEDGIPPDLSTAIAALPLADRGLNIIGICEDLDIAPVEVARTYVRLGEETGIGWVYGRLPQADLETVWDRVALVDLCWELLDLQRHMTEKVLANGNPDASGAIDRYLADRAEAIQRVIELQRSAATSTSVTTLAVVGSRLMALRGDA